MLYELRVENLLLMERAELRLAPGLNMLTGETGAGKTLLAHALDLLLGGRARRGIVRPGAQEGYVEGVFALPPALAGSERLADGAQEVVLARRVWPDGRTRAYVSGRSATLADLQELGAELMSFYGQHEHRRLMLADRPAGSARRLLRRGPGAAARPSCGRRTTSVAVSRRAPPSCASSPAGASASSTWSLFELAEIEDADPSVEEETALTARA